MWSNLCGSEPYISNFISGTDIQESKQRTNIANAMSYTQ